MPVNMDIYLISLNRINVNFALIVFMIQDTSFFNIAQLQGDTIAN